MADGLTHDGDLVVLGLLTATGDIAAHHVSTIERNGAMVDLRNGRVYLGDLHVEGDVHVTGQIFVMGDAIAQMPRGEG